MLKYLWTVTQDLFSTVTLVTLIYAVLDRLYGKYGRRFHIAGVCVSLAASAAFTVAKATTNKIISSHWNHYTFGFIIGFSLAFMVLLLIFGRREESAPGAGGTLVCVAGAGLAAAMIFLRLPNVALYLTSFNTMGVGVLSTNYMIRLVGWLLALILLVVYSRMLYRCAEHIRPYGAGMALTWAGVFIYGFYSVCRFFAPWITRAKWLHWPIKYDKAVHGFVGDLVMLSANYPLLFIFSIFALAVICFVACFIQNTRVTEPWFNPAQHRKLRAKNRSYRRMACVALACMVVFGLSLTIIKEYDTREIELSAPETYTVEGDKIYVAMEDVNDFHLHRFEYRTENNVDVRWIVVRKPNSAAYGVGLDACEVCGNAGYYERNGQVVCRRCDVIMNTNTIGFKVGCNPIPLKYEVEDGKLMFKLEDILAGEREFK